MNRDCGLAIGAAEQTTRRRAHHAAGAGGAAQEPEFLKLALGT